MSDQPAPVPLPSNAFDDLHRRTYELELLISGAIVFALLQLPSRLAAAFEDTSFHLTGDLEQLVTYAFLIAESILYVLTAAFLCHLAVRAYWIGLIGLRSVYPRGIVWERLPMVGPLQRRFYQQTVPSLDHLIDRTDRVASLIFAVSAMLVLLMVWTGAMMGLVTMLATVAEMLFGGSARRWALIASGLVVAVPSLVVSVLDNWVARRRPEWLERPRVARLGDLAMRLLALLVPMRILTPVQATLQSHLDQKVFLPVFLVVCLLLPAVGGAQLVLGRQEVLLNSYEYIDPRAPMGGVDARFYDSLRDETTRRSLPSISSDVVSTPYLQVFLPHVPDYDNQDLAAVCPQLVPRPPGSIGGLFGGDRTAPAWRAEGASCLAQLWEVSLDGEVVATSELVPMRRSGPVFGLAAYLPLGERAPGRHLVTVRRHDPRGTAATGRRPHSVRGRTFEIPFWIAR